MREIEVEYHPTPKQDLYHATNADEVLFGGAAGGGKSRATVMEALFRCMETKGLHAYLFRRTYRELEDTLIGEALRCIPPELGRYRATSHDFMLFNGSEMRFRHCAHPKDRTNYQGAEIHALFIDELTHFPLEVYDFLKTRLRAPKNLGVKPVVRCTSNPGGIGHSWVKSYFVDAGDYGAIHRKRIFSETLGRAQMRTIQYIPALATDNPHLTEDYIFELERKPKALREALLLGNWNAFEGQAFGEFRDVPENYRTMKGTHVIEPFAVPEYWPRYRSFDFGYARPFSVGWWASDSDGTLYRYAEWYGSPGDPDAGLRIPPDEIARGIAAREAAHSPGLKIRGIADPSIWDASRGMSIAETMAREGIHFEPGDNDRLAGKMQLHKRLAMDAGGVPGMYIFKSCRDWIRTVPTLPYDDKRVEDVDTDAEDHVYDETRYMLMARPMRAEEPRKPEKPKVDPLNTLNTRGRAR